MSESRVDFADVNFKRVLALQLLGKGLYDEALERVLEEHGVRDDDTDDVHPAVCEFLDHQALQPEWLDDTREFSMKAYTRGLRTVLPFWSGEQDPLPIQSFADLAKLPNLQSFDYPVSADIAVDPAHLLGQSQLRKVRIYQNDETVRGLVNAGFRVTSSEGGMVILER